LAPKLCMQAIQANSIANCDFNLFVFFVNNRIFKPDDCGIVSEKKLLFKLHFFIARANYQDDSVVMRKRHIAVSVFSYYLTDFKLSSYGL